MDRRTPQSQRVQTLSIHRAFVVRLYADADPGTGRVRGQVEHVVSGKGGEFQSLEDLVKFISGVLDAHDVPHQ